MMTFELNDILLFIRSLKNPTANFNILGYISFYSSSTRSASFHKLVQRCVRSNKHRHLYFNRLPRFWKSLPPVELSLSIINLSPWLRGFFWSAFLDNFNPDLLCTYHLICPCSKCSSVPPHSQFTF